MKKLFVYLLVLLAGLSLTASRVLADDAPKPDATVQDTPTAVSVSDLEELNNRISALEKTGSSSFKVTGLLQFWYTHDSYGLATNASTYSSSKNQWDAFSFRRGELGLTANVGNDPKLTFALKLDPTQTSFNGLGGTNGSLLDYSGGSPAVTITGTGLDQNGKAVTLTPTAVNPFSIVKDFYGKIAYSPYATFIFGQNKFAQDLEGRWATNDLDFNNYSNLATAFGNKRDIGVQLAGAGIPLGPIDGEYVFSVIQGSGQSTADNNVDKDFAERVGFTYDKNLYIGGSTYSGWEPNGKRWDLGLEGRWTYNGFKLQGEFINGHVNTLDNNAANNSVWTAFTSLPAVPALAHFALPTGQLVPAGYYILASYRLEDFRLGVRWDGYNFNQWPDISSKSGNDEFDTITLGLDWFQDKDAFKLTLNWEDHLFDGAEAYQVTTVQSQISI
jgi:hypothetical protein